MFTKKSLSTFIRYHRLKDVTVISMVMGITYGIILYLTKLSLFKGLLSSMLLASCVGLILGHSANALEYLAMKRLMRKLPPLVLMFIRTVVYSIFAIFWVAFFYFLFYLLKEKIPLDEIPNKFSGNVQFQLASTGTVIMIFIGILFYQISLLQSRNGLINYLLGRYAKPMRKKKIFMFLDLKGSTSHAENLGDLKFSSLIQDCYFDLTQPINETNADVYQYIGDEVVLVWDYSTPEKNAGCIHCFLKYRSTLKKRSKYYLDHYGFIPDFKAGLHGGDVVMVRVGEIKKEIAYHGDVLNTTARLESLCNQFQAPLIISGSLLKDISLNGDLKFESLPPVSLRGKEQVVEIFKLVE